MKTKIIFLTSVFNSVNTGPGIYANYLWQSFRNDREIDFHVVAPSASEINSNLHIAGIHTRSLAQYAALQNKALKLAEKLGPESIIHSNNAHSIWLLKNFTGPVIAQINDYDAADSLQSPIRKIYHYGPRRYTSLAWRRINEKKAISFCNKIVFNSYFTQARIQRGYSGTNLDHSVVIHKAVDVDFFRKPLSRNNPTEFNLIGKNRILFLGANWKRKGLDIAIHALKKILPSNPDCALIVAGKKGRNADATIAELPQKLGIAESVQFLGPVKREDLPHLFRECDLLTLPSREEALGVAILEALASGLPVAGSDVGGIPEILGGCQHSILVRPNDPSDLATAFQKILSSKSKGNDIQRECHAVANRFSKEVMIKIIKNLYLETKTSRI
ncbi:glycosyltransferase family 4 protein [bacterium]|nr:glycosyltransferase family 4 protein [bacterium]